MSFGFGVGDFIAVLDKAKLYRERFADAPDHFDSLSREIASLTSILEYIGRVEDQLTENEQEALAAPIKESTKLLGELENIYNDNTSLETHEGTNKLSKLKPRAVWRRLRMKPEDVQKLRQRVTMNVYFLSAIKGFRDSEAIHTTKQAVTSMHDEQTSRQEREILDWLTTTDYAPQQRDHLSRRYAGTNQWLLDSEEYKSWVSGQDRTLICPGMPGAGKTIMASVVVDDLFHRYQECSDVGVAYIYCNFKDQGRQNHYDMLSSITKQLAQCRSPIPSSLKALYDTHQRKKTSRTLEDTINVLQAVCSSYHRVFIVIDALDECESKSRQGLLSEVAQLQKRYPANVLATTREIPEIIESVHFKHTSTLEIQASDVDVLRYISSRIPDMQDFVQKRPEIQEEIQNGVLCRINGMFLLAKLLIDSLSCKTTPKAVRKALAAASIEDDTYAHFYDEALERIRVQPPEHVQLANQVLSWIVFAKRPLELNELQHALAVEEHEPDIQEDNIPSAEIIISACAGLVTLDEQGGIVRLVHQTTQEFLNKRNENLFPDADADIANTCVRYLFVGQVQRIIRGRTRDIPSWRKPYYFESLALKDLRKSDFPFCEYAILYWGHHAGNCDTLPANIGQLLRTREMLQNLAIILSDLTREDVPSAGAHLAAWFGLLQVFKNQLLPTDDVTFVDRKGQSILSWASQRGHSNLIEHILENDTLRMKNRRSRGHIEPLHLALFKAVEFSHPFVAHRLIQFASDANIDLESANGSSLLDLCMEQRDVTMIRLLLERSQRQQSDTQKLTSTKSVKLEKMDRFHGTPLAFASSRGLDEAVKLLLDHGADIEALDRDGRSPLLRAAQSGHKSTARILVQYGAKPLSQSGPWGLWPALWKGLVLVVELLIIDGADIESRTWGGMTLLSSAAVTGQLSMLVMLLNHKADIEARNAEGDTPLWCALRGKQDSTFQALLERGANTEAMDRNRDTPLLYIASGVSTSTLEILLSHKAMIEAKNGTGRTPLSIAAENSDSSTLNTLLKHGAIPEALDEHNQTPLWHAAVGGPISSVAILKENGADINYRNMNDMTPIMKVAKAGWWQRVEELSELGGDLEAFDEFGRTAILLAAGAESNLNLSTDDLMNDRSDRKPHVSRGFGTEHIFGRIISKNRHLTGARDHQGRTALWWAVTSGKTRLLGKLAEVVDEVEVLDNRGIPPLMSASARGTHCRKIVQLLLEHVSQFGPDGARLKSREGITERAISYVRFFLQFNNINPDTTDIEEVSELWLSIKPGMPLK